MRVTAIQKAVESYRAYLDSGDRFDHFYLHEITERFHQALEEEDSILSAILIGLQSDHSQRLWLREQYEPKKVILQLGNEFPDYFKDAIHDLYDESKLLENRIDRFKFYCEELLALYKKKHKAENLNHHYVDESFISLLLMGRYPETYAYYDQKLFISVAKEVGAKPIPKVNDYPRFQKFSQIFNNYISKNDEVIKLHKKRNATINKPANLATECMTVASGRDLLDH
jgi:hypothetical protein